VRHKSVLMKAPHQRVQSTRLDTPNKVPTVDVMLAGVVRDEHSLMPPAESDKSVNRAFGPRAAANRISLEGRTSERI